MKHSAAAEATPLGLASLQAELDALRMANDALQEQTIADAEQVELMLRELERQRNELREAHRQLQATSSFATRVMDTVGNPVVVLNSSGRILQTNRSCREALGKSATELAGTLIDDLLPPEEKTALATALPALPWTIHSPLFETVRAAGSYAAEHRLAHDGGEYATYLLRANLLHNPQGKLEGAVVSAADISTLKAQERAMRLAASVFDSSLNGIMITAPDGTMEQINPAFTRLTGYTPEEAIGKTPRLLRSDHHPPAFYSELWRQMHERGEWTGEIWNRRKDGTLFIVWHSISAVRDEQGAIQHYVGTFYDITEQKQATLRLLAQKRELEDLIQRLNEAQSQLLQSEKMAAIGQLAAGVAHEINNPIGFVASNLSTLKSYVADLLQLVGRYEHLEAEYGAASGAPAEIAALKKEIGFQLLVDDLDALMTESKDGLDRVKKIVQDLKDFSYVDNTGWQPADLHRCLDTTLNVAHNEIKYKVDVTKAYGEIPQVECLPSEINQVFMNLIVNAAQAIPEHGTITLRTGTEGEGVWVEVEDTGCGIADEHMAKIFEPFFTTKPIGKGTGLGLSLSYGIVKKHKGRLSVASKVGVGTTFRLWLPVKAAGQNG